VTWGFISQAPRSGMRAGGIFPAIVGPSFWCSDHALLLPWASCPRSTWWSTPGTTVHPSDEALRGEPLGHPSIVYGLFGFTLFVMFLRLGTSILAGCLTLAIMSLPV